MEDLRRTSYREESDACERKRCARDGVDSAGHLPRTYEMALREIFDVSGGANIIAKAQGKTNLKHGAYLRQPIAYSLTSTSHMRTPGQWKWRSKSTKFQIHSTSQILLQPRRGLVRRVRYTRKTLFLNWISKFCIILTPVLQAQLNFTPACSISPDKSLLWLLLT